MSARGKGSKRPEPRNMRIESGVEHFSTDDELGGTVKSAGDVEIYVSAAESTPAESPFAVLQGKF